MLLFVHQSGSSCDEAGPRGRRADFRLFQNSGSVDTRKSTYDDFVLSCMYLYVKVENHIRYADDTVVCVCFCVSAPGISEGAEKAAGGKRQTEDRHRAAKISVAGEAEETHR